MVLKLLNSESVAGKPGQMAGGSRHLRMRQLQEWWDSEGGRWGFHEGNSSQGSQEPVVLGTGLWPTRHSGRKQINGARLR